MHNNKAPRRIITVSLFTGLSRLLGLIRDMLFSRVIGISYVADAFFIALRIPNIIRRITSEGAFSASFIPIFSRDFAENKKKINKICRKRIILYDYNYYFIGFVCPNINAITDLCFSWGF